MIIKNIDHLISGTSDLLGLPEKVCRDVILSQFGWLKHELTHPTHPSIRIHHLGNFYIPRRSPRWRILQNINKLRKADPEYPYYKESVAKYKNEIKYMWDIRHKVDEYHNSRIIPNNSRKYLVNFEEDSENNTDININNDQSTDGTST